MAYSLIRIFAHFIFSRTRAHQKGETQTHWMCFVFLPKTSGKGTTLFTGEQLYSGCSHFPLVHGNIFLAGKNVLSLFVLTTASSTPNNNDTFPPLSSLI